jgi:integrase
MASQPWISKRGQWQVRYKPDPNGPWVLARLGKGDYEKFKKRPDGTKPPPPGDIQAKAREFADIEWRAAKGLTVAPTAPKSLADHVESYMVVYRGSRQPGSVRQMERHARDFVAFAKTEGVSSFHAVTRTTCRQYLEKKFGGGKSHNALVTEKGYLAGIWTQAVDDGLIPANPWKGVKPPGKPSDPEWTLWSPADIDAIANRCLREWQQDFVRVLGGTGIRISTALAMRWDWIDWAAGVVNIPKGPDIKTAYPHVMSEAVMDILQQRYAKSRSDLAFPNPKPKGGIMCTDSAREAMERAIKKAGVKHGTPHDLRHSYARSLVLGGVPITVVQRQLGHTTLAMTMRYCLADEDNVKAALEQFAQRQTPSQTPDPMSQSSRTA